MDFKRLVMNGPILKALCEKGYKKPTAIQEKAIPVILEGRDMIGLAQTGTGKTAAFAVPILQMLHSVPREAGTRRSIKALILSPTRELADQINESIRKYARYTGIKNTVVFGGVSQKPQVRALMSGVDILVATPGRLLDLIEQKYVDLRHVTKFVIDEADRMLDMGFSKDMEKITGMLPSERQTLLFSATMSDEIRKMVFRILKNPVRVEISREKPVVEAIEQSVYFVKQKDKRALLIDLLQSGTIDSVLVFTRTKRGADKVTRDLVYAKLPALAIHGDKSQYERKAALESFKKKNTRILVATDVAARGIDIRELSHVINYDMPNEPEMYIHRIGRTGRAGMKGSAFSFCDSGEKGQLMDIQKLISRKIPVAGRII